MYWRIVAPLKRSVSIGFTGPGGQWRGGRGGRGGSCPPSWPYKGGAKMTIGAHKPPSKLHEMCLIMMDYLCSIES